MKTKHIIATCAVLQLTFLFGAAQLQVQNGAAITTTGGAIVSLQNTDLICNGTITQSTGGIFKFYGSGNNTISGTGNTQFDILEIAKDGSAKLLLSKDVGVNSTVQFTSGLIDVNNYNLLLQPTASLQNETEISRITGSNGGAVNITNLPAGVPNNRNAGNLGAVITSSQNVGNLAVSRSHKPAVNPASAGFTGIQRTFNIQPQFNVALNATLRFYYLDAELNGKDESSLVLWKSEDGINWQEVGADSRNSVSNYVEKTGITAFSSWTLTDASNPLPIKLLNFSAVCNNSNTGINWTTATEINAASFTIEKSLDGNNWSAIATVEAANNANGHQYSYADAHPTATAFYRLKLNDKDGSFIYSPVFSGGCSDVTMPFAVYPNPAVSSTVARIAVRQGGNAVIKILSADGKLMQTKSAGLTTGVNAITLQVAGFAAGSYTVQVLLQNGTVLRGGFVKQ